MCSNPTPDIIFDSHIHTTFSDGELSLDEAIVVARKKGYAFGITDHGGLGGDNPYNKLNSLAKLEHYISTLRAKKILFGLEVDAGISDVPDELVNPVRKSDDIDDNNNRGSIRNITKLSNGVKKFDYLILSMHHILVEDKFLSIHEFFADEYVFNKTHDNPIEYWSAKYGVKDAQQMLNDTLTASIKSLNTGKYRIFGHSTAIPLLKLQDISFRSNWAGRLLNACQKNNTAVEINNFFKVPKPWFMELALKSKVLFSTGSDAHTEEGICNLKFPLAVIAQYKIPPERMFTPELLRK